MERNMVLNRLFGSKRMLFLSIMQYFIKSINSQDAIDFNFELDKTVLYSSETLSAQINLRTLRTLTDVSLRFYTSRSLRFRANISACNQLTCDHTATIPVILESQQSINLAEYQFDQNRLFNVTEMIIPLDQSTWSAGSNWNILVRMQNLKSDQVQLEDHVCAELRYRIQSTGATKSEWRRRQMRIQPVRLSVTVVPDSPIYANSVLNLTITLYTDQSALPVKISLFLPHKMAEVETCNGKTLDQRGVDCQIISARRQSISILGTPIVRSSQGQSQFLVPLTMDNFTEVLHMLVRREHVFRLSCVPLCHLDVQMIIRLREDIVRPRDELIFEAKAYYGTNLSFVEDSNSVKLNVLGADLSVQMWTDAESNGLTMDKPLLLNVIIEHTKESSMPMRLVKTEPQPDSRFIIRLASCEWLTSGHVISRACHIEDDVSMMSADYTLELDDSVRMVYEYTLTQPLPLSTRVTLHVTVYFALITPQQLLCLPEPCQNGAVCKYSNNEQNKCDCPADFHWNDCSRRICAFGWARTATSQYCYWQPPIAMTYDKAAEECTKHASALPQFLDSEVDYEQELNAFYEYFEKSSPPFVTELWLGHTNTSGKWTTFDKNVPNERFCGFVTRDSRLWQSATDCTQPKTFLCQSRPKYGIGETFVRFSSKSVHTKQLQFDKVDIGFSDELRINQPVNSELNLRMPHGTIKDMVIETTFTSEELHPIPVEFVYSRVTAPTGVQFSRPELLYMDDQTILELSKRNNRFRRSQAESLTVTFRREIGDIVNSADTGEDNAAILIKTVFVSSSTALLSRLRFRVNMELLMNDERYQLGSQTVTLVHSTLTLSKTVEAIAGQEYVGIYDVSVRADHSPTSNGAAQMVHLTDDYQHLRIEIMDGQLANELIKLNQQLIINQLELTKSDNQLMVKYRIEPELGMPDEALYLNTTLTYHSLQMHERLFPDYPGVASSLQVVICLVRDKDLNRYEEHHNHRISSASFGLLFLVIFALAMLLLMICYARKNQNRYVSPRKTEKHPIQLEKRSAKRRVPAGLQANPRKKEHRNQQLIDMLLPQNPQQKELAIQADTVNRFAAAQQNLEERELDELMPLAQSLMADFGDQRHNRNDLQQEFQQLRAQQQHQQIEMQQQHELEKELEFEKLRDRHQRERRKILRKQLQPAQEKAALAELDHRQRQEQAELELKWAEKGADRLHALLSHAKRAQTDLLSRHNMNAMHKLQEKGAMDETQAELVRKELDEAEEGVRQNYDEQRAKERMQLTLQHQQRKHMAQTQALIDRQHGETLDDILAQQKQIIDKLYKEGVINQSQRNQMIDQLNQIHSEQREQHEILRNAEMLKLQQKLAKDRNKKLDKDAIERDRVHQRAMMQLDEQLNEKLLNGIQKQASELAKKQGLPPHSLDWKPVAVDTQAAVRLLEQQLDAQQDELRKQLEKEMDNELAQQKAIRQHQGMLLKNVQAQQEYPLTDEERAKLLQTLQENKNNLDRKLTMIKVDQLASADEKHKQRKEQLKLQRSMREVQLNVSSSENELNPEKRKLLKYASTESLANCEKVEKQMLNRRAKELQALEHRVGKTLAQLQLEKFTQQTDMGAQEAALELLTGCMLQDLSERGLLSNPDAKKILQQHEDNRKQLEEQLAVQRNKQEQHLAQQLADRTRRHEQLLEQRLQAKLARRSRSYSSQVHRHMHTLDMVLQHTRDRLSIMQEHSTKDEQDIANERSKFERLKQEAIQRQELEMLRTLVNVGGFKRAQIEQVLRLVLPHKQDAQLQLLADNICTSTAKMDKGADKEKRGRRSESDDKLAKRVPAVEEKQHRLQSKLNEVAEKQNLKPRRSKRKRKDSESKERRSHASEITEYLPKSRAPHQRPATSSSMRN